MVSNTNSWFVSLSPKDRTWCIATNSKKNASSCSTFQVISLSSERQRFITLFNWISVKRCQSKSKTAIGRIEFSTWDKTEKIANLEVKMETWLYHNPVYGNIAFNNVFFAHYNSEFLLMFRIQDDELRNSFHTILVITNGLLRMSTICSIRHIIGSCILYITNICYNDIWLSISLQNCFILYIDNMDENGKFVIQKWNLLCCSDGLFLACIPIKCNLKML